MKIKDFLIIGTNSVFENGFLIYDSLKGVEISIKDLDSVIKYIKTFEDTNIFIEYFGDKLMSNLIYSEIKDTANKIICCEIPLSISSDNNG